MASEEAATEALKYKTWVLKVSIHCEGCKKKVKRVLQSIDGVYAAEVDALQNKVTVTGDVDAGTLIKKLAKSNKHAELWPEKNPSGPNPTGNTSKKNQSTSKDSSRSKDPGERSDSKPSPPRSGDASAAVVVAAVELPSGDNKSADKASDASKAEETAGGKAAEPSKASGELAPKGANKVPSVSEEKNNAAAESSNPPADKAAGPANGGEKAAGGGKNKGKKGRKENDNGDGGEGSAAKEAEAGQVSQTPPPQTYHYPVYPPPPAYVMSYSTAHPSASQAYYAAAMPPVSQGYVHSPYPPPPELYYGQLGPSSSMPSSPPPPPPPGSYDDMFSDENPNSCNLM